jgi:hypothetical protein
MELREDLLTRVRKASKRAQAHPVQTSVGWVSHVVIEAHEVDELLRMIDENEMREERDIARNALAQTRSECSNLRAELKLAQSALFTQNSR